MKKILLLVLFLWAFINVPISVSAGEYEFSQSDVTEAYPEEEMDSLIKGLPEDVRIEIEDFISSEDDDSRREAVKDKLDIHYWLSYIADTLRELLIPQTGGCAALLSVIILSSVLERVIGVGRSEQLKTVCGIVISLVIAVSAVGIAYTGISAVIGYIDRICNMMTAMLPVMEAVMLTSGSVSQSAVNGTALMIYITVTESVTGHLIVPMASALFALSTTAGVFKGINISSLISALKRLLMTLLGFFLMIFSFVLGIQNSLARSADSLGMKTVRFAVGSYVPIVGGAVSEALTTLTAGLSLIKQTAGAVGIIIIMLILLPPLLTVFLCRLSLLICKTVADILECSDASRIIGDADSVLSVFLALAVMSALFFIFAVTLFMNSGLM